MARLTIHLQGDRRTISVGSFIGVLKESLDILRDLDAIVSQRPRGTLRWVIGSLREGSAVLEMESRVLRGDTDNSERIARSFTDGLNVVASEGVSPPLFTLDNLMSVLRITQAFHRDGITAVDVQQDDEHGARLDRDSQGKVQPLVGVHHRVIGSIEGRIELVSLHHPYRRFNIYHSRTGKAVRCTLPEAIEADVIEALRKRRRVIVSGEIAYNVRGEPLTVSISGSIRVLPSESELPSLEQMLGAIPDLTGDLTTEEHLRRLRGGIEQR